VVAAGSRSVLLISRRVVVTRGRKEELSFVSPGVKSPSATGKKKKGSLGANQSSLSFLCSLIPSRGSQHFHQGAQAGHSRKRAFPSLNRGDPIPYHTPHQSIVCRNPSSLNSNEVQPAPQRHRSSHAGVSRVVGTLCCHPPCALHKDILLEHQYGTMGRFTE